MENSRGVLLVKLFAKVVIFVLGVVYLAGAIHAIAVAVENGIDIVAVVLILVFCIQAYGHFFFRKWAMKLSVTVLGLINFLAIFSLPSYPPEEALVEDFPERLRFFLELTALTAIVTLCYWVVYHKTKNQTNTNN